MANAALAQLFGAPAKVERKIKERSAKNEACRRHLEARQLPFTVLHVQDFMGNTRQRAREAVAYWERCGYVAVTVPGKRGAHTQWEFVA